MTLHEGGSAQSECDPGTVDPGTISLMGGMGGSALRGTFRSPVIHEEERKVNTVLRLSKEGTGLIVTTASSHDLSPDSHSLSTSAQS
jgi:hypothetical protein